MVAVIRQVHGYRQGHQLLATSESLPKVDQALVDRLSDVAGPLRPKERFDPYLSAYPLPSGDRYVLARTWQDSFVARAGCVRTLSLIIPTDAWSRASGLASFLTSLDLEGLPTEADAQPIELETEGSAALLPAPEFPASELLEALFLEEAKPVAVFDAPNPELIAIRLLTALWPPMRRRFALSTFALSPRKVSGRDFDLVFAPKDARAKFSDWHGRRIDGRAPQGARHKWTSRIVGRVFDQPKPQLLTDSELNLLGDGENRADTAAALRIALLWDDLAGKLETTPTAALGLLDIANSGMVRTSIAFDAVEPGLANAIRRASLQLPAQEAWNFLGAIVRKMHGRPLVEGNRAVRETAEMLASRAPEGGVLFLSRPDLTGATADLAPSIANGIAQAPPSQADQTLIGASDRVLGCLLVQDTPLAERAATSPALVDRLTALLSELEPSQFVAVRGQLLPHLADDWQLPLAEPLIASLDGSALAAEAARLGRAGFSAIQISHLVVERALQTGSQLFVRTALAQLPITDRRDLLLAKTLRPIVDDVAWLLASDVAEATVDRLLVDLLRSADDHALSTLLSDTGSSAEVVRRLSVNGADILERAIGSDQLPLDVFVRCVVATLAVADPAARVAIAEAALRRSLPERFEGDAVGLIASFLGILGGGLSGPWVVHFGLHRDLPADIASRNVLAFQNAPAAARKKIVAAVAELADALYDRRSFDLDATAVGACAQLMTDAGTTARPAMLSAAGRLLPTLMRQTRSPVSPLVATLFPAVYRELLKEAGAPDLLKIVPFFAWDRCKAARHDLVSAFLSSSWQPGDLALTACRSNDVVRIMRRTARAYGGEAYIKRVRSDLRRLPDDCRKATEKAIAALTADWSSRYSWHD